MGQQVDTAIFSIFLSTALAGLVLKSVCQSVHPFAQCLFASTLSFEPYDL